MDTPPADVMVGGITNTSRFTLAELEKQSMDLAQRQRLHPVSDTHSRTCTFNSSI